MRTKSWSLWRKVQSGLEAHWYQRTLSLWCFAFIPLSYLFALIVFVRRFLYQSGFIKIKSCAKPVIVVGNISVGGTGKTPVVIHIAKLLQARGLRPGIVSRGYRGKKVKKEAILVTAKSDPLDVGDEPVLMAKRVRCKVSVGANRAKALQTLLQTGEVDVVISDDGLQHYALPRHIEIAVIDGERRFGNGWCLPCGPLREPISRLTTVPLKITNGGSPEEGEYDMFCKGDVLQNALNPLEQLPLGSFSGIRVNAIAGIANPHRFFNKLVEQGLWVIPHVFPDHHAFKASDIDFKDNLPIIMTEKDAVKCQSFVNENQWILPINAVLNPLFDARLLTLLKELKL